MIKKNILLGVLTIVLITIVSIFVSCDKEELKEDFNIINDIAQTKSYRGISLENTDTYGDYLSFKNEETFFKVLDSLSTFDITQMEEWEQGLSFLSLRSYQEINETSISDFYPELEIAALLNPNGYIMIDGKLYKDEETGSKIYHIQDDGTKQLVDIVDNRIIIGSNNLKSITSGCNNYDEEDEAIKNFGYGQIKVKLIAKIDYSSWYDRVRLITETSSTYSESLTGWIRASTDMKMYYTYSILVDGNLYESSGTSSGIAYGTNYYSHIIVDGSSSICIGYIYSTHEAWRTDWGYSDEVQLRIE